MNTALTRSVVVKLPLWVLTGVWASNLTRFPYRHTGCPPKKTQHLIKWYLSVDIYALSSISWYCRIGNAILHKYVKFHYQKRSGYLKI